MIPGSMDGKYTIVEHLGNGSYGHVYSVRRNSDGELLCCKDISYSMHLQKGRELLQSEIEVTCSLNHPNIIRFLEVYHDEAKERYQIIMNLYQDDLLLYYRRVKKMGREIDENFIWCVLIAVLKVLDYCHNPLLHNGKSIIHRDIKPANILLTGTDGIVVTDFGVCREMHTGDKDMTYIGTPLYMPPEARFGKYTTSFDIWSLGCTMYEVITGKYCITGLNDDEFDRRRRERSNGFPLFEGYSPELHEVVQSMLVYDFEKRPTAAELLGHPAVKRRIKALLGDEDDCLEDATETFFPAINQTIAQTICDFGKEKDVKQSPQAQPLPPALPSKPYPQASNSPVVNVFNTPSPGDFIQESTTPLMRAVQRNDMAEVRAHLGEAGKQRTDGFTALMFAAMSNNLEAVRLLADKEANIIGINGFTALAWAKMLKRDECVKFLEPIEGSNPKAVSV